MSDLSSEPDPGDADQLAQVVLGAARALFRVISVSLAPALDAVTISQLRALVLMSQEGPVRIGALAERLGVHQSTFTRTTDRMVTAGLVARLENPDNRREVLVAPTEDGRRLLHTIFERRRAEIAAVLARLSAEESADLLAGLEAFSRAAGDPDVDSLALLGG